MMKESPTFFDRAKEDDERALCELARRGTIAYVSDTIASQLGELVRARHPAEKLGPKEVDERVRAFLGDAPECYGKWVHFPWSGRLVHVLPQAEHFELRTSRNRNKITRAEQEKLAKLVVGIAGLSVGQATALALALEGVGGTMRLADHDVLGLSNLNRLRAGIHEIGVNKAVITARAIWEIDPYAKLELFTDGVTDENIERFVGGLDLLFEECDDLAMKVRLREVARAKRIPVLMETSDRGMMDIERFDLEPERPLFHGLVGDIDTGKLRGLSTADKVPFILALIGDISPRAAASLVDIDTTLETWPQLASAVSLGAAVNTDCARRIALGQLDVSGRFYVDLEHVIGGNKEEESWSAPPPTLARKTDRPRNASPPDVETIVRFASLAPSGGNAQPWRFVYHNGVLECHHDPEPSMLDFEGRAAHLALGAALENARLACCALGIKGTFERMNGAGPAWTLVFGEDGLARTPEDDLLAKAVELRVTNRKLGERKPLPEGLAESLQRVATDAGAWLDVYTDPEVMAAIGEIVARSEKLRMLHPALHREMMDELDRIGMATLELSASDAAGLQMLRSSLVVRTLRAVGGGDGLKTPSRKAVAAASALALLRIPGASDLRAYLRGGEALQRVWLLANARGVAVQPMTAVLYLLARNACGGEGLDGADRAELCAIREDLDRVVGHFDGAEIMLFRLAIADSPTARSLRRPVSEILSTG